MDKNFLSEMISCVSPSGREDALQKCLYRHYKEDFDGFTVENQGTLTASYGEEKPFKVLLAAHADEISLVVTGYNGDGSLQVERNGGVAPKLYIGAKVRILTKNGIVHGVAGTNPSLQKKSEVSADELFIDVGCESKAEAEALVPKGSYIVHDTDLVELSNGKLAARAFDDRIGVYIVFEAAKKARGNSSCAVYACATTGEETTGRGAYAASARIRPDICVAVDVTYATDYASPEEAGDVTLGKGGVICRGSIPNERLNELLAECAKELNLPVQYEVFAGRTGTDADTMLKVNESAPQVLFSIPLRYMHSPVETLSVFDVDSMIEILARFLEKINEDYDCKPYTL